MATAEVNPGAASTPMFWNHLRTLIKAIPRAALLSMIGPSILLLVGYFGWRYYGAPNLDRTFYGVKKENIHITPAPPWIKTSVVDEVYEGRSLSTLSLLESQTAAKIARAFDAHPWVRKTQRVEKLAGVQIMVNVEYRVPVAMVACVSTKVDEATGEQQTKQSFLPVDSEGFLLPTKDFSQNDVPQFIWVYAKGIKSADERRVGTPIGDSQIEEAVRLCKILTRYREALHIERVNVYSTTQVGKSKWILEIEIGTGDPQSPGPRIVWGHAPGLEELSEPTAEQKLKRLIELASQSDFLSQKQIRLDSTN